MIELINGRKTSTDVLHHFTGKKNVVAWIKKVKLVAKNTRFTKISSTIFGRKRPVIVFVVK